MRPVFACFCFLFSLVVMGAQELPQYRISAQWLSDRGLIQGSARVTFTAQQCREIGEIRIDPQSGGMDPATGRSLLSFAIDTADWYDDQGRIDGSELLLPPGHAITLEMAFTLAADTFYDWRRQFDYLLFPGSEAGNAWYPLITTSEGEHLFFDYTVDLTTPVDWTALCSGKAVRTATHQDRTFTSFVARRIQRFALNLGFQYANDMVETGDIEVAYFCAPHLSDTYREAAELTADAISWYRKIYGFFPVEHIGIAEGNARWGGGFPAANVFYIHRRILDAEFLRWITSHELGHYYWGLYVQAGGERTLDWIMIANGIWIDQMYIAERNNRSLEHQWRSLGAGDFLLDYLAAVLSSREQALGIPVADENELDFDYNSWIRHGKAATGLYLLSQQTGYEAFLNLQRQILNSHAYTPLSTEAFLESIGQLGWPDATSFLTSWMQDGATIEYSCRLTRNPDNGKTRYEATVRKDGTVAYPVEIVIRDELGNEDWHVIDGQQRRTTINGALPGSELSVVLDPDGKIPMWNSAHPDIQRLFILAMERAGHIEPFRKMATDWLSEYPHDAAVLRALERWRVD